MQLNGVPESYRHYAKRSVPQPPLDAGGAVLKIYHLEKPGEPVPPPLAEVARNWLAAWAGQALEAGDCGFVILHRCGADFYFLLLGAWRESNEAWEAAWYRDGGMAEFAPFAPAYPAEAGVLRPTFCVWELAVVAHEALAWARFLSSPHDEADLARWRADRFSGAA